MTYSLNKVSLIGNLGKDPELISVKNSTSNICIISLATTDIWKDKNTGEKNIQTDWHKIVCYSKLSELSSKYLRKGSRVYVEGKIKYKKWNDKNTGQERYSTEIIAYQIIMLDKKSSGSEYSDPEVDGNKINDYENIFDDEIPF